MAKSRRAEEAFILTETQQKEEKATKAKTQSTQAEEQDNKETRRTRTTTKRQGTDVERRSLTVYLPKDLFKKVRMYSFECDSSMTNVVIDALQEYFS